MACERVVSLYQSGCICLRVGNEMKRWKILSAVFVAVVLLATNLYLILKEDSKVSRSIFVKDWAKVEKATVTTTFNTEGVTTSADEYKVYFHDTDKAFKRFLVKEGDKVTTGTPLYEYTVKNFDQQTGELEREIANLEGEITGVDDYIQKLTDYKDQVPSATEVANALPDGTNLNANASSDLIISTLEQEIYKQELEKSKLEDEKTKLDSQLMALNEQSGPLTMDSEVDGIVKKIDDTLGSPIMTIASTQQAIEGILSESEYRNAKVGMAVKIKSPDLEKTAKGKIVHVDNYPSKEPSLDNEATFPFQVKIVPSKTKAKPLVIGSKMGVTVITNQAIGVPTVSAKIVHGKSKSYVYKLTDKGYVNKEYISTGLRTNKKVEIVDGPTVGENVLVSPWKIPKNHSTFITPIQADKVVYSAYDSFTPQEKWRYFLIGMLEK